MFKKISLISLIFIIATSFIVFIFTSMSETLNNFPEKSEFSDIINLSGNDFSDFSSDFNSGFELIEEKENSITLEEELIIGEKLSEFMSSDEVKNLNDEERMKLEEKIKEIDLDGLKKMSIKDFIDILRIIKN